ncbi:hypothetical protein D3C72_1709590 [compost metagenome]
MSPCTPSKRSSSRVAATDATMPAQLPSDRASQCLRISLRSWKIGSAKAMVAGPSSHGSQRVSPKYVANGVEVACTMMMSNAEVQMAGVSKKCGWRRCSAWLA